MITIKQFLIDISRSSSVYILIGAVLLITLVNRDMAAIMRLNYFKSHESYPLVLATKNENFDEVKLIQALQYYKLLVQFGPQFNRANGIIGYCYYRLGEYDRAIALCERALENNPRFFWHRYNLGVIYFRTENYTKAIECFQTADPSPKEKAFYWEMMKLWQAPTDGHYYRDGLEHLALINFNALKLTLAAYYRLGRYEDIVKAILGAPKETILKDPLFYLFIQGVAHFELKNFVEAESAFRQCYARGLRHADLYDYWGRALEALGKHKEARALLALAKQGKAQKDYCPYVDGSIAALDFMFHPLTYLTPVGQVNINKARGNSLASPDSVPKEKEK